MNPTGQVTQQQYDGYLEKLFKSAPREKLVPIGAEGYRKILAGELDDVLVVLSDGTAATGKVLRELLQDREAQAKASSK